MNRLTKRTTCGTANLAYPESCYFKSGAKDQIAISAYRQQAIERLAAYEDTGLEPEEIQEAVDLFKDWKDADMPKEMKSWVERCTWHVRKCEELRRELDEYKKAEAEGRLVVLPCKVGDTVYKLFDGKIREMRVVAIPLLISPGGAHLSVTSTNYRGAALSFELSDFGKTVFLTREEAEKALEGK